MNGGKINGGKKEIWTGVWVYVKREGEDDGMYGCMDGRKDGGKDEKMAGRGE